MLGFGLSLAIANGAAMAGATLLDGSEADGTSVIAGGSGMTSGWNPNDVTLTNAAAVAPDGTTTASSLVESNTSARHIIYITGTVTGQFTASAYFKQNTRRYAEIYIASNLAANGVWVMLDIQTGTVTDSGVSGTGVLTSVVVQAAANGFWKITITGTVEAGAATPYFIVAMSDRALHAGGALVSDNPAYLGDGVSGFYIWRPKLVD